MCNCNCRGGSSFIGSIIVLVIMGFGINSLYHFITDRYAQIEARDAVQTITEVQVAAQRVLEEYNNAEKKFEQSNDRMSQATSPKSFEDDENFKQLLREMEEEGRQRPKI